MMSEESRVYVAIDLKSFYASVECRERGLSPLSTHLVVADEARTSKTICLAVSPSLKAYGIPGRPRLFEVEQAVQQINTKRRLRLRRQFFVGTSCQAEELARNPRLSLDFIRAVPRMALYITYSEAIYRIYLRYIAPEDIHVYSIDEVFIDATAYCKLYGVTARQLVARLLRTIEKEVGITATAGIGTNLYLAKIAMDIVAKHLPADSEGLRIATLDEMSYRRLLWNHTPLTDFWRVGKGYARALSGVGIHTMGDIARCSIGKASQWYNPWLLYKLFGVQAELLMDHAWGRESCTMADIKSYRPKGHSKVSGQVLHRPYSTAEAATVVREMADELALDLAEQRMCAHTLVLHVGYDVCNSEQAAARIGYTGPWKTDSYGRCKPASVRDTHRFLMPTNDSTCLADAACAVFERIVTPGLWVRRITVGANEGDTDHGKRKASENKGQSLWDFSEAGMEMTTSGTAERTMEKRAKLQQAVLTIRRRFGKDGIIKGVSLQEEATGRNRHRQIGGHRA